ncbi:MAG: PqqD family protein [Prevotellaceae bacterium]|nr:PqqD family protein [Prevotellaceae bacterium]
MKLKPNFELRDVCGENVVIPCGIENVNFDSIIHLNETGAFLWREAEKADFTVDSLTDALLAEYDTTHDIAAHDVAAFVQKLQEQKLVE